jgi:hypothetical protein
MSILFTDVPLFDANVRIDATQEERGDGEVATEENPWLIYSNRRSAVSRAR